MPQRFRRLALGVLAYNLLVVLWGALVRVTGSGAGCGDHWPLCNGEVLPLAASLHTAIEFTHRAMSGLALVSALWLFIAARRTFEPQHPARIAAKAGMGFMLMEALLGAMLVLFRLVALDASLARAIAMSAHLVNTFLLLAALALAAHHATDGRPFRFRGRGRWGLGFGLLVAALPLLGVTGAIAALGDTLFPATTLAEGFAQDAQSGAHLLLRLRVAHPVFAVLVGFGVAFAAGLTATHRPAARDEATLLGVLFLLQLACGLTNLVLLAPAWMQLLHLLLADLVWLALVRLAARVLAEGEATAGSAA